MGVKNSKICGIQQSIGRCKSLKALKRVLSHDEEFSVNKRFSTEEYENVTPIWLAARYDDIEIVRFLIEANADVNLPCCGLKMTPLHMAANNHNQEMVELLLKAGANPDIFDRWNYSPLMYVAMHNEPFIVNELFRLFVQYGCDINFGACLDDQGKVEHMEINTDLIDCGGLDYITYVREPTGPTSGTALHLVAQNPYLTNDSIDILLSAGASPDKPNLHGQTPLMGAIMDTFYEYHRYVKGHAETLVHRGSKVESEDKRGWTAVHYAAQRGSSQCLHLLMRAGADCNHLSLKQESPLWILLTLGWRETTVYLIENGCDVNRPMSSMNILGINQNCEVCRFGPMLPIEFALCNRDYQIAEALVCSGCKITQETWLGHYFDPPEPKHEQFMTFLRQYLSRKNNVQSLKEVCRQTIRTVLQQRITVKLEDLSLPPILKDYICLRDLL